MSPIFPFAFRNTLFKAPLVTPVLILYIIVIAIIAFTALKGVLGPFSRLAPPLYHFSFLFHEFEKKTSACSNFSPLLVFLNLCSALVFTSL